jgi:hypothetical protein
VIFTTRFILAALVLTLGGMTGCRGGISDEPPIHLNPNMDNQDKYKSYRKSSFFADGRTMRTPPANTVARGKLREDGALWRGVGTDGKYLTSAPIKIDIGVMKQGQSRYNIYCAPCHDKSGYGAGNVAKRSGGILNPTNFHLPGGECTLPATAQAEKDKLLGGAAAAAADSPEPEAAAEGEAPAEPGLSEEDQARLAELEKIIGGETGCTESQQCIASVGAQPDQCIRRIGWIYNVITNGSPSKLMGQYRHQIPDPRDRWAVAGYIRALQRSQNANRGHVLRHGPKELDRIEAEYAKRNPGK